MHPKPGSWRITSACLRNLWRVGTPLAAERAALSSAQVLLVRIVSGLGTVAIAANSLGVSAEGLCYMAGYGIQDASIALIGQAVGAHRRDMAKRFAWLCTAMGIGIMALSGVGSGSSPRPLWASSRQMPPSSRWVRRSSASRLLQSRCSEPAS
ncbi:MAG: MATE family efflux transporter [Faecalibacterium prausnitzii]